MFETIWIKNLQILSRTNPHPTPSCILQNNLTDQIFQNIVSTDKEKQIGARQRAGIKTETKDRSALPKRFSDTPLKVDRPSGVDVITGKSYVQNKIEQNNIFKQKQIEKGTDSDTYEINI